MSEQDDRQASIPQRPTNEDKEVWKAYWKAQGQPWRTEPEITAERQAFLADRRAIIPDIEQGIYPFKDIKLNRADVEWLLATHENGRGPIDWSDESQRERKGLDLRAADLCKANLVGLPLSNLCCGVGANEQPSMTEEQWNMARAQLQGAALWRAQLQGATFGFAQLQGADLWEAQLQGADFLGAQLQGAILWGAQLQGAALFEAQLQGALLGLAQLQGADLRRMYLEDARLDRVTLSDEKYGTARLADIKWGDVNLSVIDWETVKILGDEQQARQKKDSQGKTKEKETRLKEYKVALRASRQLAVVLRNQGLNEQADYFAYRAQVLQRRVLRLQIETLQWMHKIKTWLLKSKVWKLFIGLKEKIQSTRFWKQMVKLWQGMYTFGIRVQTLGRFIFSWFLDILAGYGYKPIRILFWYLVVIGGFATAYAVFGHLPALPDALVFSFMSFHGRGFFPSLSGETNLHNPLVVLAAAEAVIGLLIEISLIATFSQRYFGK